MKISDIFKFRVPKIIGVCKDQERAKDVLKDLLAMDHGLTDGEIKWVEIWNKRQVLTAGEIEIIDEIYARRC